MTGGHTALLNRTAVVTQHHRDCGIAGSSVAAKSAVSKPTGALPSAARLAVLCLRLSDFSIRVSDVGGCVL